MEGTQKLPLVLTPGKVRPEAKGYGKSEGEGEGNRFRGRANVRVRYQRCRSCARSGIPRRRTGIHPIGDWLVARHRGDDSRT